MHPLAQTYLPQPFFLSLSQVPMQMSPLTLADFQLPCPCLTPSWNCPSQHEPLAHRYLPFPWNLPFLYSPLYLSPLTNTYTPNDSFIDFMNVPQQYSFYESLRKPWPSFFPSRHSPLYTTLVAASRYTPRPFLMPSIHCPSQMLPLESLRMPVPFFLPLRNCPLQTCLSGIYSRPSPSFSPSPGSPDFHPPMQNFPEKCQRMHSWFWLLRVKITQFLYFFTQSCFSSSSTLTPKTRQVSLARARSYSWVMLVLGLGGRTGILMSLMWIQGSTSSSSGLFFFISYTILEQLILLAPESTPILLKFLKGVTTGSATSPLLFPLSSAMTLLLSMKLWKSFSLSPSLLIISFFLISLQNLLTFLLLVETGSSLASLATSSSLFMGLRREVRLGVQTGRSKQEVLCRIFPASQSRRLLLLPKRRCPEDIPLLIDYLSTLEPLSISRDSLPSKFLGLRVGDSSSPSWSMDLIFSICISRMIFLSLPISSLSLVFSLCSTSFSCFFLISSVVLTCRMELQICRRGCVRMAMDTSARFQIKGVEGFTLLSSSFSSSLRGISQCSCILEMVPYSFQSCSCLSSTFFSFSWRRRICSWSLLISSLVTDWLMTEDQLKDWFLLFLEGEEILLLFSLSYCFQERSFTDPCLEWITNDLDFFSFWFQRGYYFFFFMLCSVGTRSWTSGLSSLWSIWSFSFELQFIDVSLLFIMKELRSLGDYYGCWEVSLEYWMD